MEGGGGGGGGGGGSDIQRKQKLKIIEGEFGVLSQVVLIKYLLSMDHHEPLAGLPSGAAGATSFKGFNTASFVSFWAKVDWSQFSPSYNPSPVVAEVPCISV